MTIVEQTKKLLVDYVLRPLYEAAGNPRFSRPALYDLDVKLSQYLNFRGGIFVELGANDGFTQSNTYYLEKFLGWRGLLIEPLPHLYRKACRRRPRAQVFQVACVADDDTIQSVEMIDVGAMSFIRGALKTDSEVASQIERGQYFSKKPARTVHVPTATLTKVLEKANLTQIDFLSLDVEGYEAQVLRGLDFEHYMPRYMLIETRYREDVEAVIPTAYELAEQMTYHDFFYVLRK